MSKVFHILLVEVAGRNPQDVTSEMDESFPMDGLALITGVSRHDWDEQKQRFASGEVEVMLDEDMRNQTDELTPEQIEWLCGCKGITSWRIELRDNWRRPV